MTKTSTQTAKPVKRLLRRRDALEYYNAGGWTTDVSQAESFSDILEASRTCVSNGLKDVELVLRMGTGVCDIFCTGIR